MSLTCAVYTRKSSEEGLEQDFNSLDAQREACEAFILSQKGQGWKLGGCYDDGGFSGGTVERPGLQRLLADIGRHRVQVVVVYKVDRLTRSLADFSKLVELFDAKGVSFVSVTQQFNTTTSMGRLTLNVLLSFAQFEREVTGERIRDKIAASKRKGMWMGGNAPMGYVARDRGLVIDEPQAERVREIMKLYLSLGSVPDLKDELDARGWRTPPRAGLRPGEQSFSRGHLRNLLTNPSYVGMVRHKGQVHAGLHRPIVDQATWDSVQAMLARNDQVHNDRVRAAAPCLLAGLLVNEHGTRFEVTHANKRGKRYRYYVVRGEEDSEANAIRVAAPELEAIVLSEITRLLESRERLQDLLSADRAGDIEDCVLFATGLSQQLAQGTPSERVRLLKTLLAKATIARDFIEMHVRTHAILGSSQGDVTATHNLRVPVVLKRSRSAVRLIVREPNAQSSKGPDQKVVSLLAKASRWFEALKTGAHGSIVSISEEHGVPRADVTRIVYLAFLAPDIVERVASGDPTVRLGVRRLMTLSPLPLAWSDQRRALGLDP